MKSEINDLMHAKNYDYIFIGGTQNSNPVLQYLVPNIQMFHLFLILRRDDVPVILYNNLEKDAAEETGFDMLNYTALQEAGYTGRHANPIDNIASFYIALCSLLNIRGRVACNIVGDVSQFHLVFEKLQDKLPAVEFVHGEGTEFFNRIRVTKDVDEIEAIRKAGKKTCEVFLAVEELLKSMYDRDGIIVTPEGKPVTIGFVKKFIEMESARRSLQLGVDTIFSQGRDAGVPHNGGNHFEPLKRGTSIVFDYFPTDRESGYCFDMTRSYCINDVPEHLQKAYNSLKTSMEEVEKQLAIGKSMNLFHLHVCDFLEGRGYPTNKSDLYTTNGFTHGLGHGIGVEVHEDPGFGIFSTVKLSPGMVFTVEPGLYFPEDGWGLRLEDIIAVFPDGTIENLTVYPKNLLLEIPLWSDKKIHR